MLYVQYIQDNGQQIQIMHLPQITPHLRFKTTCILHLLHMNINLLIAGPVCHAVPELGDYCIYCPISKDYIMAIRQYWILLTLFWYHCKMKHSKKKKIPAKSYFQVTSHPRVCFLNILKTIHLVIQKNICVTYHSYGLHSAFTMVNLFVPTPPLGPIMYQIPHVESHLLSLCQVLLYALSFLLHWTLCSKDTFVSQTLTKDIPHLRHSGKVLILSHYGWNVGCLLWVQRLKGPTFYPRNCYAIGNGISVVLKFSTCSTLALTQRQLVCHTCHRGQETGRNTWHGNPPKRLPH